MGNQLSAKGTRTIGLSCHFFFNYSVFQYAILLTSELISFCMTPASLLSSHYLTLTEYSPSTTTLLHTVYISRNLSCPFIWLLSLYLAQIQLMFFHLIVSSCISHNFNCPFLEPVTFATRATLAVLHLIVTLMSFYFVCLLRLYLAQIKLFLSFGFFWI